MPGSISKSGCCVLFDVDKKTTSKFSHADIFKKISSSLDDFFLKSEVKCCFVTQKFDSQRDDCKEIFHFADLVIDSENCLYDASSGFTRRVNLDSRQTAGPPSTQASSSHRTTDEIIAGVPNSNKAAKEIGNLTSTAHTNSLLSIPFYTQRLLRILLPRSLCSGPCTVSDFTFVFSVSLEATKCFVFLNASGSNSGYNYCCILDVHLVNFWLALEFAEENEPSGESNAGDIKHYLIQKLNRTPWFKRIPSLFIIRADDNEQVFIYTWQYSCAL